MFTSGDNMALLYYTIRMIKILKQNIIENDMATFLLTLQNMKHTQ